MVTSKRKIETERDRFGGFDESPEERSVFRAQDTITLPDDRRMYSRAQTTTCEPEITFSGRESVRTFPSPDKTRVKRTAALTEEDLMPSIKTMSYAEQKSKASPRERMEGKTKVMLAVYMLVVVLLAAIVIGTGIVINSLNANINRINAEIESSNLVISEQAIDLAILNDPYYIAGVAQDADGLNMVPIDPNAVVEIEIIPFEEAPVAASRDWFDAFCDWMQNLLGG